MRLHTIAAAVLSLSLAAGAYAADKTVAVVNGVSIPQAELDQLADSVTKGSNGRVKDSPELRAELKQQLITRQIIVQESARRGLDKTPQFKERMDAVRNDLLQQSLLENIAGANPVADSQIKAEYDRLKGQLSGQKEVKARQIIVGTEEEANQIIAQAKKGSKFEDLARSKSKGPSAKQTGGEMDWVNLSAMAKPLADELKSIGKGQVSAKGFKTEIGYHIFKIEDMRDAKVPSYEEAKPQIGRQMQNAHIEKTIAELRNKAKIQ